MSIALLEIFALSKAFAEGGKGALDLAGLVLDAIGEQKSAHSLYESFLPIEQKIEAVAKEVYGAKDVVFLDAAREAIRSYREMGISDLPVCIAKTQYSLSDDPKVLGRPQEFTLTIRDLALSAGAEFFVCYAGDILTMPGLPTVPAANGIDVDERGVISGLF